MMVDSKSWLFISRIILKNVRCFKQKYEFSFLTKDGLPANWVVILGNNNTGKSTLLRLLAKYNFLDIKNDRNVDFPQTLSENSKLMALMDKGVSSYSGLDLLKISLENNKIIYPNGYTFHGSSYRNDIDKYRHEELEDKDINPQLSKQYIDAYGTYRGISETTLTDYTSYEETTRSLFFNNESLTNAEEWLLQLDYAFKSNVDGAKKRLSQITDLITGAIFDDIEDVKFETSKDFKSFVLFLTTYGWVRLRDLSYGYQSTITWVVDLAKRMFDRYPELENPLHGPAIVLVDEIDLHLHPEWQRKIIKYLSDLFPNTQFIVTAHSPLIVQSAENVNLIMLEKDDETGSINVRQQFGSFQGWTVEEILRELMDMGEKTRSDRFLKLLEAFEKGLDEENYEEAKAAYDELDKILHPASSQRKLLSIQLSSLVPA
jgi:predicted ATP-binding protein involved in virulence